MKENWKEPTAIGPKTKKTELKASLKQMKMSSGSTMMKIFHGSKEDSKDEESEKERASPKKEKEKAEEVEDSLEYENQEWYDQEEQWNDGYWADTSEDTWYNGYWPRIIITRINMDTSKEKEKENGRKEKEKVKMKKEKESPEMARANQIICNLNRMQHPQCCHNHSKHTTLQQHRVPVHMCS